MERALIGIGAVLVIILNLMLTMFTISTLWGWFIVTLGAPMIGWEQAYGLALIMAYIKARYTQNFVAGIVETRTVGQSVAKAVGVNLGVLLIGWIATLFM